MYWLKGCPRCHGDLHEIADLDVSYVSCIQCGKVLTAAQEKVYREAYRARLARKALAATGRPAA